MSTHRSTAGDRPVDRPDDPRRSDHSPWNWLLVIPIVLPLLTFIFNRRTPTLAGFPFFYWFQLALVLAGVGATALVYQMTKRG
jgi:hypothetical protein